MTENSHWQTLNFELDQNIDEFDRKYRNKYISLRRQTLTCEFDQKYQTLVQLTMENRLRHDREPVHLHPVYYIYRVAQTIPAQCGMPINHAL